jgi:putative ABC transport system permease protein
VWQCPIRSQNAKVEYEDDAIENVILFGITEKYGDIQKIEVDLGRYLQQSDFEKASNNVVMGYSIAEKLFGKPEKALNKLVEFNGKKALVIGVIKKQGQSMLNFLAFDDCMIMSYAYLKTMVKEEKANPAIMVQGKEMFRWHCFATISQAQCVRSGN